MSAPTALRGVSGACDSTVRWGLVALIAITPLAFGTVERWSMALMEWGIVTLLLIALMGHLWLPPASRPPFIRLTGLEFPLLLFLGFCTLQTVPIPMHWLSVIAPGSARLYSAPNLRQVAAEEWPDERFASDDSLLEQPLESRRPVSLRPDLTWERIRLLVSFACLFVLAAAWARTTPRVLFLLGSATVVGCLVGAQGLVQYLTSNRRLYWVRQVPPTSSFGPFVNHNHFAGYVEMIIPVTIALSFYLFDLRRHRMAPRPEGRKWLAVEDDGSRIGPSLGALTLFGVVLLVVTLFLSRSRGGIFSTVASGAVFLALLWRRDEGRLLKWAVAIGVPIVAASLILWIGVGPILERFGELEEPSNEASLHSRVTIWRAVTAHLPDFAWVGSGLGSFEHSFAPFMPAGSDSRWDKAHNDYLQIAWETGAVGSALIVLGLWVFLRRYWLLAVRSRSRPLDVVRIGVAASLLSMALHSLIDFNLQIGANGFLFVLLCGLLVSLNRLPDVGDSSSSRIGGVAEIQGRPVGRIGIVVVLALTIGCETTYFAGQATAGVLRVLGERAFFRNRHRDGFTAYQRGLSLGGDNEQLKVDEIELLLFGLDQTAGGIRGVDLPLAPEDAIRRAHRELTDLVRRFPYRAYYWSLASDVYLHRARLRRREQVIDLATLSEDPLQNLVPEERLGASSLLLASRLEPHNALYHDLLAELYLDWGLPERARPHCARAVASLPDLDYHLYVLRPDVPEALVEAAVAGYEEARRAPSMLSGPFIAREIGRFLLHHGKDARAVPYLEEALAASPRSVATRYFLGQALFRLRQFARALEMFEAETRIDTGNAWAHYYAGLTYRELGRVEEALESLGRARELEPSEVRFSITLGEMLEQGGKIHEAERLFRASAKRAPPQIGRWLELLAFYRRQGNRSGVDTVCDQLGATFPDDASAAAACADRRSALP